MDSKNVLISTTPVVLSYFAMNKKGTRQEVTKVVFDVANKMKGTNLSMDAVFRGYFPEGPIKSETVDNELWYWFSNNFLKECPDSDDNDVCFEKNIDQGLTVKKTFEEYKIKNLPKNLKEINWGDDANRIRFIEILSEALPCAE